MQRKRQTATALPGKHELLEQAEERDIVKFIDSALQVTTAQLPRIDASALRLVLTIFRVSDSLLYDLESSVQRPAGLSSVGFHLLWTIWIAGPIESSVAATMMGVSRATVSGISATVEKSGLLVRTPSSVDGRAVILDLTTQGRKRFEEIFLATNDRYRSWVAGLTEQETDTLVALLAKLAIHSKKVTRHRNE
ncbi:MarR family winged helix-turn-helix transcriptional regulator [Paraburkholderia tropica]|uniref:MarR family winged helix-turn-helix transcriptional regulator n=1 Tax=Paraburkholderia tropica TaxID=92647 RepID=UPI002AB7AAE6|nr:MarR family transcriptional regulator [Paraburkholderia tropica]